MIAKTSIETHPDNPFCSIGHSGMWSPFLFCVFKFKNAPTVTRKKYKSLYSGGKIGLTHDVEKGNNLMVEANDCKWALNIPPVTVIGVL